MANLNQDSRITISWEVDCYIFAGPSGHRAVTAHIMPDGRCVCYRAGVKCGEFPTAISCFGTLSAIGYHLQDWRAAGERRQA